MDAERIIVWILLIAIAVRIFFMGRETSYYTARRVGLGISLVDLDEFKAFPDDMKKYYRETILPGTVKKMGDKATTMWADPASKAELIKMIAKAGSGIDTVPATLPATQTTATNPPAAAATPVAR
jgi:hypothetical protein